MHHQIIRARDRQNCARLTARWRAIDPFIKNRSRRCPAQPGINGGLKIDREAASEENVGIRRHFELEEMRLAGRDHIADRSTYQQRPILGLDDARRDRRVVAAVLVGHQPAAVLDDDDPIVIGQYGGQGRNERFGIAAQSGNAAGVRDSPQQDVERVEDCVG